MPMMKKVLMTGFLAVLTTVIMAHDSLQTVLPNELALQDSSTLQKPKHSWLKRTIRGFSHIDTNYVEPQHYDWAVMVQGTYSYDYYRLRSAGKNHQSVAFAPSPTIKFGPYFGWRWIFLGYTFDLRNLHIGNKSEKQEFDFSIYSAQIGCDLYYRRTGSDYKITHANLGSHIDKRLLNHVAYNGISVGITGISLYYIFNHQRFSYPAAFAQSTCQKISCGSCMAGLGYMRNSLDFDHQKFEKLVSERTNQQVQIDSGLMFNSVKYTDVNASVGYAYNWVFAPRWLLCSSLALALAYKYSEAKTSETNRFNIDNFNVDGIGRFGLVWNNTRWFAGLSAIVRVYNYHKSGFATSNIFGSVNVYAGYNFGLKKKYRKGRVKN